MRYSTPLETGRSRTRIRCVHRRRRGRSPRGHESVSVPTSVVGPEVQRSRRRQVDAGGVGQAGQRTAVLVAFLGVTLLLSERRGFTPDTRLPRRTAARCRRARSPALVEVEVRALGMEVVAADLPARPRSPSEISASSGDVREPIGAAHAVAPVVLTVPWTRPCPGRSRSRVQPCPGRSSPARPRRYARPVPGSAARPGELSSRMSLRTPALSSRFGHLIAEIQLDRRGLEPLVLSAGRLWRRVQAVVSGILNVPPTCSVSFIVAWPGAE